MKIFFSTLVVTGILSGAVADGQTPPAAPAKPTSPSPAPQTSIKIPEPAPSPMLFNIRVDVVVTEEGGDGPVSRKEVSLTIGDGRSGSVRSGGGMVEGKPFDPPARLWVDAQPRLAPNGKIRTLVTLFYLSPPHFAREGEQKLEVLLENGKPLAVSQTSSATSERRMRVELTATVLK